MQEDFNYHAALYAGDNHPHRTATSGGVPFGDGLNTLSDYAFEDFERVKWNDCTGTDCLTPKGFTFARVRLAEGVYVDVYNVHTNAGADGRRAAPRAAPTSRSCPRFIQANSAGNAVIVMGDTNTRYTRTRRQHPHVRRGQRPHRRLGPARPRRHAADAGQRRAGLPTTAPTNACEVVDKILYRGSTLVNLTATRYNNE